MQPIFNRKIAKAMGPLYRQDTRFVLVKYGGGVVQMSGSIAGDTHARNRSGNYIRARTKPINPNTALQQRARNAIAFLSDRWAQTLTVAQRTAWNLYADSVAMLNKLGETIHLSGYNHYIRSNSFLAQYGITIIDAGPTTFELPAKDPTLSIAASEATQQYTVTFDDTMAWASEDNAYMAFLCGQPQNAQRNFFDGPYKGIRFLSGNSVAPLASPLPIGALHVITEGQHLWIQARIYRADGRVSEIMREDCFCGA
jgi:hypothetical protein